MIVYNLVVGAAGSTIVVSTEEIAVIGAGSTYCG